MSFTMSFPKDKLRKWVTTSSPLGAPTSAHADLEPEQVQPSQPPRPTLRPSRPGELLQPTQLHPTLRPSRPGPLYCGSGGDQREQLAGRAGQRQRE